MNTGQVMPHPEPRYIEVAVAAPLQQTLTYAAPAAGLAPGQRLLVPLGRRLVTGYLLGFTGQPPADCKVKAIADLLDSEPLFPAAMIPFYRWIANYYHYPIGEVIRAALPGGLTTGSGRKITLTDRGKSHFTTAAGQDDLGRFSWLAELSGRGMLTTAAARRIWRTKDRRVLEKWQAEGLVRIETVLTGDSTRAKTETCLSLSQRPDGREKPDALKPSEQKTLDLLAEMAASFAMPVPRRDLVRRYAGARKALPALIDQGLVELKERPVYRDPFGEPPLNFPEPDRLTGEQETVLAALAETVGRRRFAPALLFGTTGSGKTEVYLRAAAMALTAQRAVIVLVPEIALAAQLEGHFISRFGDRVALLHSGLSAGERFDQWLRIVRGEAQIVIGARSAIFAPFADAGLIIVDEEHDGAYKQEDGLRYQARDLAVLRGRLEQATVILGSATPSVTSFHHAKSGRYRLLTMAKRIEDRPQPEVQVVDLQKVPTVSGRPPLFSPELTAALRENLRQGDQSLVFLNRRGFANLMLCQDCGQTVQCRHCRIALTLHKGRNELVCHYCGFSTRSDMVCGNCRSGRLIAVGFGPERIENELHALFPTARIARLDRDTTVKRSEYLRILKSVHRRETDILVGTQMITKGHHFPHVTLVGIVWADAGLGLPDFKAGERTFQVLSQVTGRAGRGEKPGRVIIQTHQPQHYSISTARCHDYESLYEKELTLRRQLRFPPFTRLINLRIESEDEEEARSEALELAAAVRSPARRRQAVVLGPAPAPLSLLRGRYRWQLMLASASVETLHALCRGLTEKRSSRASRVKLTVDVDPENML